MSLGVVPTNPACSFLTAYRGEKVLVTGGAGFIGSHLVEALVCAGARVTVLDNLLHSRPENLEAVSADIEFRCADIRRPEAVKDAIAGKDAVFHLAANASVPRSVQDPCSDFECNALGTLNVLEALRSQPAKRCVVVSSGAVYGQPLDFPITESHPLLPISPYGASKMAAEALCRAFHSSYGVTVQIGRVFNTFGPRQPRFVMFDFYKRLVEDQTQLEILGDGKQVRDFCYVSDTVDALLRVGRYEGKHCEAFNISSGTSYSVTEVALELISLMELNDVKLTYSGNTWAGDAQRWEVSIGKLAGATGYAPRFSLRDGLGSFVAWFKDRPERCKA